ncbi:MAG: KEOPS complex kinase/ATPase Bud32 [Nanoarchaeota archaeon]
MSEIARGAEAIILADGNAIQKVRPKKGYRIPEIDVDLRKRRTARESRILSRLHAKGIPVPKVLRTDGQTIEMERISGPQVKEVLDENISLARKIGEIVARMHDCDVIHGDLTTSNMILHNGEVVLIDFGLGFHSKRREDKACDIHLFLQSLESRHHKVKDAASKEFLKGYANAREVKDILKQLEVVESRGRYKSKRGEPDE